MSASSLPGRCIFKAAFLSGLAALAALAQSRPVALSLDATEASRGILHSRLVFSAKPGPLTLLYPKWIPGEHSPSGPITDVAGLKILAAGKPVPWQRDAEDMYAFHLDVPAGANALEVELDFLLPQSSDGFSGGGSATSQLVDLSWNQVLLYPKGARSAEILYAATLRLPKGWRFGTALTPARVTSESIEFSTVSLETLVDSPVIAGAHFREVDLNPAANPVRKLHIVADSEAALDLKPEDATNFTRLTLEEDALFGARHYRSYHFLLTLSEHVAHFGLEHHESSDNRAVEKYLTDEDTRKLWAGLLPHEMVHSWNGKYRRPSGLATAAFDEPMKGELLWVYEGLTDYLGGILTARSGLWTNGTFRERLALTASMMQTHVGRTWRPLVDTTIAAQLLYYARPEGAAWRRQVDFYPEGDLIWLEADVIIRQQTHGRRSLDDFCRSFFGGESGPPKVVSYTLEDVLSALKAVAPYDWRQFFQDRVYAINAGAPLGGVEGAGWRLAFTNTVPDLLKASEALHKVTDLTCSLGLIIKEDGTISDVIPKSPAALAGVGPDMKLVAVNERRWTPELLRQAVKAAGTNSSPVELLVENQDYFKTCPVDYHRGEQYPCLERDHSKPDLLAEILKPLVTPKTSAPNR